MIPVKRQRRPTMISSSVCAPVDHMKTCHFPEADDLVGMRVMAPFPRAHLAVEFHPAIVLDVSPDDNGIPLASDRLFRITHPPFRPRSFTVLPWSPQ